MALAVRISRDISIPQSSHRMSPRRSREMAEQVIAKGNAWDLGDLGDYESHFAEGDKGRLDIKLRTSVPEAVVKGIDSGIRAAGIKLTSPVSQTHSTPTLHICFKKGLAPLAIIPAAVGAAIISIALVTAWQLTNSPAG